MEILKFLLVLSLLTALILADIALYYMIKECKNDMKGK